MVGEKDERGEDRQEKTEKIDKLTAEKRGGRKI